MIYHQLHLLDNASELLGIVSSTGLLVYTNPFWERVLGYTSVELAARSYLDFVYLYDVDRTEAEMQKALQGLPSADLENRCIAKDGSYRWIVWRMVAASEGSELYLIGRDVTEQKQLAALRAQLIKREPIELGVSEKWTNDPLEESQLAMVSRELRTPLCRVIEQAQLLQRKTDNANETLIGLQAIERNAKHQMHLIEDIILALSLVQGRIKLAKASTNLSEVVLSALETVLPAAKAKNIAVATDGFSEYLNVSADAERLQQAISNILFNAIKFTREGGVISVRLLSKKQLASVQITDRGEGISANFLPHVFDRFRQSDSSNTRQQSGLGLGLTISQHLIEMHNGTIRVHSPGKKQGTTVTVSIPLA